MQAMGSKGDYYDVLRPYGVWAVISPFNFPMALAGGPSSGALVAGNTVVFKPASLVPWCAQMLAAAYEEAGLPKGVVNVITTKSTGALSEKLLADPRLRKVSFTGSTPVGVQLLKQAADNVLKASMELGGNAPFVVFEDADLDKAVEGALLAKFRNIGQACTAANRFIVHEAIADEFARRIGDAVKAMKVGRGTEEGVTIGPLVEDKAVDNAVRLVESAVDAGATLIAGGKAIDGPGSFFEPTVLDGVDASMAVSIEEIFGPVVAIQRFATEDDAVRLANDTEYGLVGYVFTEDAKRGQRMIDRIDTGMMGLNVGVVSNAAGPFGGVKQSGLGRELGPDAAEAFTETKNVFISTD
jgi:succinate-semialdehyde dehydrogenase/glutarate-semialdehyde dehydrogenase